MFDQPSVYPAGTQDVSRHDGSPQTPPVVEEETPHRESAIFSKLDRLESVVPSVVENGQTVQKTVRRRLMVIIPASIGIFMLAMGLISSKILLSLLDLSGGAEKGIAGFASLWILIMTGFALSASMLSAYVVSKSLKNATAKVGALIPHGERDVISAPSEMSLLNLMIDEISTLYSKYAADSQILNNLPQAFLVLDTKRRITAFNKKASEMFCLQSSKAVAVNIDELIEEDEATRFFYDMLTESLKGKPAAASSISIVSGEKRFEDLWIAISPLEEQGGRVRKVIIHFRDQSDLLAVRTQIQRLERLAAIGSASSAIAHEIRNPLASVKTLTELIQRDLCVTDVKINYTAEVLRQLNKIDDIFEDILSYARQPVLVTESVQINNLLARAYSDARRKFTDKRVTLKEHYASTAPLISADPDKLSRAFFNILKNAFEALPEEGLIQISTNCHNRADSRGVEVVIRDNGSGILDTSKIFDLFYTTKKRGNGLGLSLARNIFAAHGATVEVHSEPGKGTDFSIFFPMGYRAPG